MSETWLFLDVNYLAYRAFYALGGTKDGKNATWGTTYGILQDIAQLQDLHCTTNLAFCFDYGYGKRKQASPSYKASRAAARGKLEPGERAALAAMEEQVDALRSRHLVNMGFSNVFFQEGYESDDIIASLCAHSLRPQDTAVIVSSDKDLYQLLSPQVSIYNPTTRKAYTSKAFFDEWGIPPVDWPKVKAIAGCDTDDVGGVQGVGEVTAAKYLRGLLKADSAKVAAIRACWAVCRANLPLVKLPYPGTQQFTLRQDNVTDEKWSAVAEELGYSRSMRNRMPMSGRARRRGLGVV